MKEKPMKKEKEPRKKKGVMIKMERREGARECLADKC